MRYFTSDLKPHFQCWTDWCPIHVAIRFYLVLTTFATSNRLIFVIVVNIRSQNFAALIMFHFFAIRLCAQRFERVRAVKQLYLHSQVLLVTAFR